MKRCAEDFSDDVPGLLELSVASNIVRSMQPCYFSNCMLTLFLENQSQSILNQRKILSNA